MIMQRVYMGVNMDRKLYDEVKGILELARSRAYNAVNFAMCINVHNGIPRYSDAA